MSKLREHLEGLRRPVEIDAARKVVDDAERAVRVQVEALTDRIANTVTEIHQCCDDAVQMTADVDELDDATAAGKGLLATLRASLANDEVEKAREQSAQNLVSSTGVLARRMQRAMVLAEHAEILRDDVAFAIDALNDLAGRARGLELESEAGTIERAATRLTTLEPRLQDLANPLLEPIRRAHEIIQTTRERAAQLRSTERAATLGETVLDELIPAGGGAVTDKLRNMIGEAVPSLVPDLDRSTVEHQRALDEMDDKLHAATESARREEDLRRAAEAELDELEWEP